MPDYLSCGACHAEFEVVDFYRFLDHKVSNCNVRYNAEQALLTSAESVLECSKCLKKFRTPWALLQHLESDHCMSLARTLLLPSVATSASDCARQRSVEHGDTSEACTQTSRSCLRRQVCPYEEGLPDDCCLKATKEQRASDQGCCCMDSFGAGGRGCGGDCSGGAGGGRGARGEGERQTDCCLAVPKKRRLLTAVNGGAPSSAPVAPTDSGAAAAAAAAEVGCCGLMPDSALLERPAGRSSRGQTQSVECQTDFDVSLLDFDVDMLLDDTAVDVPTSLVSEIGGPAVNTSALSSSTSPTSGGQPPSLRLYPAPSKAIQTVRRIAMESVMLAADTSQPPQPSLPQPLPTSSVFLFPATMQYQPQQPPPPPQFQQQDHQQFVEQQAAQQQQLQQQPCTLPPLPLPSFDGAVNDIDNLDDVGSTVVRQQPTQSAAANAGNTDPKFRCSQCPRTFRQNIHLRKHVMSQHSHSKPHKCPSCEYTTVEKSHLTVHIRKHTGERPYRCRECEYSTAQNCTLKAHYLRKHPGSIVLCGRCGHDFVTEHERDKHEKNCSTEFAQITGFAQ